MTWSRLVPIGAFLVLVVFLAIGLTRDPSVIPTEMIDREMPAFELPELREDGVMITQDDLKGETTLVNVFGSWCVACLQEHPTLMAFVAVLLPALAFLEAGGLAGLSQALTEAPQGYGSVFGNRAGWAATGFVLGLTATGFGALGQPHLVAWIMTRAAWPN